MQVQISAGRALKERPSVHRRARPGMKMYGAVYTGRECTGWGVYTGGAKFF